MGFLTIALVVALPLVLVPALLRRNADADKPFWNSYWFKANVYIAIFSFFGNYFGSEYFFDVLGMVYVYPMIELNFDSFLLGSGQQKVPLIMYLLTQAYFMTYHSSAVVCLRRIRTSRMNASILLWPVAVFVVAYFWAWMETRAMANPWIENQFYYKDLNRMLKFGSAIYATYFIASFPIFYQIDEDANHKWSLVQSAGGACAASALTLLMLDFIGWMIGSIA
ncbi:MAG: hypothetical protein R3A47_03415 [Polyangiales bacterium]